MWVRTTSPIGSQRCGGGDGERAPIFPAGTNRRRLPAPLRRAGPPIPASSERFAPRVSLGRKLDAVLDAHRLRIVYPVAAKRRIVRVDGDGEITSIRRSPKRASVVEVLHKLLAFRSLLAHPHLTIELLLLREDHVRGDRPERVGHRRRDPGERRLIDVLDRVEARGSGDVVRMLPALVFKEIAGELSRGFVAAVVADGCPWLLARMAADVHGGATANGRGSWHGQSQTAGIGLTSESGWKPSVPRMSSLEPRGTLAAPCRGGNMTDEDNKELVRRHFEEIWNRRNLAACEELMAASFIEHAAAPFAQSAPGQVDGPQAMRGTVEWLLTQFPDIHMTIEQLVAEDDIVAARITAEGSNTGKLNGFLPPSGKRWRAEQSHWFRVRDGKLAEHWATRDDLVSMLQLGVITPPRLSALLRQARAAARYRLRGTS